MPFNRKNIATWKEEDTDLTPDHKNEMGKLAMGYDDLIFFLTSKQNPTIEEATIVEYIPSELDDYLDR